MTRPRITVVDVPVKAMTTGKRKAAGKPKSWRVWVIVNPANGEPWLRASGEPDTYPTRDHAAFYARGDAIRGCTLTLDPPKPQQRRDRRR